MRCPYCGSANDDSVKFCINCGADLRNVRRGADSAQTLQLAANTGAVMGKKARMMRLEADYTGETIISDRMYNLILAGTVLWGILVNIVMCLTLGDVMAYINPIVFYILYFVLCFAGIRIASKSHNPWISFLGYNMIVVPFGLILSVTVQYYLRIDPAIVTNAFFYTALICVGMIGAVMAFPDFFAKLGGMLLGCLIGMLICEIILLILRVNQNITDWICAGMFSLYIGFDIYRSQQFAKTVDNAVDCALDIYLDIANLFVRLLSILSRRKD